MFKKLVLSAAMTLALASPAFAGHCPRDAKAINAAMSSMSFSDATKATVIALRDKGMALHKTGDHRQSEGILAEAMRILLTSAN